MQKKSSWGFNTKNMDTSVRPQDDFYHYANGGWMKTNTIPKNESRWGFFMKLRYQTDVQVKTIVDDLLKTRRVAAGTPEQMIRDFYSSGLNLKKRDALGIRPLTPLLTRLAGLKNTKEFVTFLADLSRIGITGPFGMDIDQDAKDTTAYIMHVYQSGLGMPDRDYYLNDDAESVRIRSAYVPHIAAILRLGGATPTDAKRQAATIMVLETKLAEVSMNKVDRREIEKTYNVRTLAQLTKSAPAVDWAHFLKRLGAPQVTRLVVMQPDYIAAISGFLTDISLDDWKLYMRWQLLNDFAGILSSAFMRQQFAFYGKTLTGAKAPKPLWRRTLGAVNGYLGEPLGKLYVQKHFTAHAKKKMNELVDDLFDAYRDRIKALDWMTPETKKKALKKLGAMTRKIGYPDKWKSYKGLKIVANDYVGNILRAAEFEHKRDMKKMLKPVDRSEWYCDPQTVNAFNALNMNDITFPAGILQPPFFDPDADAALNYGAIGAVIGHEMTHSFDDEGSKLDLNGNLKEWWTPEDKKRFEAKSKLIVEQFNAFEVADGVKVNGKLTLGENIADFGGLTIAYDAYQTHLKKEGRVDIAGFTPEQRFFIGFALFECENVRPEFEKFATLTDTHSPGLFRINGPLSNFSAFYDAYEVKQGDKLYRAEKDRANIW